ncbi:GNAT family N-acetyltransferase [Streptacidiphilus sp. P02-A3a]|uniref:GNAT family N-acetyltransferase n=1 Tax=Streptacidiphilus sp. P02-A3a TaxID=2704468 RepID=UPI0015F8808D|nr:GNAT family N-acetyltransferase [Streptacidiphilus sp. P02-A3a]QMU73312.1 GNAT family N-acetyltransferase [Streptacidiphilus sp. P02-A3a]
MEFSWDLLRPMMLVPYLPTLGPLHPDTVSGALLGQVLAVAGTGAFLPHDKDQRWSAVKDESVLPKEVDQDAERTLIPTVSTRGRGTVKVHLYGNSATHRAEAAERALTLAATHGAAKAQVIWFLAAGSPVPPGTGATRVQLRTFIPNTLAPDPGRVLNLDDQPDATHATFAEFADKLSGDGFAFLWEQVQRGTVGPVLTIASAGRIVGAIGPMETMADPGDRLRLLPQYFAVLPDQRGHGHGRALWRAAMHWGQRHGAEYQLLQTEVGGASDRLCQAEGLTDLGTVHSVPA